MDRQTYIGLLESLYEGKKVIKSRLTRERHKEIIAKVEAATNQKGSKEPEVYRMSRKYSILEVDGSKRLAKRNAHPPRYYVCDEDLYDVIRDAHFLCEHRGEKKTMAVIAKQYANVTWEQVRAYVTHCETCIAKKANQTSKAHSSSVESGRSTINRDNKSSKVDLDEDDDHEQSEETSMYPYLVETSVVKDDQTTTDDVDVIGADTERERLDVEKEKLAIIKEMWAQKKRLVDVTIDVMNLKRQKLELELQQLKRYAFSCPTTSQLPSSPVSNDHNSLRMTLN